jgi:hypothetical protein
MNRLTLKLHSLSAILCLASLQIGAVPAFAQAPAAPNKLFIQVIEGEAALNDIRARTAREPIVQVEDENHKPVAGALVFFETPGTGPSGTFSNGLSSFRTTTLSNGRAVATGFKPNGISGSYQIQVHATLGHLSTVSVINQTNVVPPPSTVAPAAHAFPLKAVAIVGAVAAGVAVAVVLATRNSSQGGDSLTPGTGTVTAPAVAHRSGKRLAN